MSLCGRVPCAVIPQGDVIILPPPPPATPWKFPRSQVSRILDWDLRVPSMPSRQPVGPVTHPALASLFQRTSLTSHLGPPALRKTQTYIPCRIRLRVMLAASLHDTLTEAARSSGPSAVCRRSCTLGSPGRFPHRRVAALRSGRSTEGPAAQQTLPDAARKPPSAPYSSRNGAAVQQAW